MPIHLAAWSAVGQLIALDAPCAVTLPTRVNMQEIKRLISLEGAITAWLCLHYAC